MPTSHKLSPKRKVQRAIVKVGMEEPFFGHLVFHLKHKEEERIPTACVNRQGVMLYSPDFIEKLNEEQTKFTVVHEILHVALSHLGRKNSRNAEIWNIAVDLVVNNMLKQEGFEFPDMDLYVPDRNNCYEDKHLKIENIHEKSSEQVYDEVEDQLPEKPSKGSTSMGRSPRQSKDGDQAYGGGQGQSPDQNQQKQQDAQGQSGQSTEQSREDEDDSQGSGAGQGEDEDSDGGDPYNGDLSKTFDYHDYEDQTVDEEQYQEVDDFEREIEETKRKALVSSKQRGETPLGMERLLEWEKKSKINWKSILQRFITNSLPFDYTYQRPNKKYHHKGYYLPSTKNEEIEVTLALDTSGSIRDDELGSFATEVYGMIESFQNVKLKLIQHDAKVQKVDEITRKSDLENLDYKGGGGTSHVPVFEHLKDDHGSNNELMIAFTDGWTRVPEEHELPQNMNVVWVVSNHEVGEERLPYGKIIRNPINEYQ